MAQPEPVSVHLAEALGWLVGHSQAEPEAVTPGSLELAEVLWLARQLPEPPRRRRVAPQSPAPIAPAPDPQELMATPQPQLPEPEFRSEAPPPPDPFLPTPFPEDTDQPGPDDTLLPVAVLPDEQDVAWNLEGMLPGRVREEKPLGDRETLLRALAPLLRRRPDSRRQQFAEERSVDLYAQTGLLQAVFEPSQGPPFDEVLLLRDGGVSMQVWRRQAEELQRVLASTQVFPRVRLQELQPGPVQRSTKPAVRQKAVEQLAGMAQLLPGSRALLLLLSDTAGRHWWDGRMLAALEIWGRTCPTAVLHPLPMWHWNRTALAAVERVSVRNSSPAAANRAYGAYPLHWWDDQLPRGRDLPLPVLPLDQQALGIWSAVVMGHPACASSGVALLPEEERDQRLRQVLGDRDLSAPAPAPAPLTAEEAANRWGTFQSMASPEAQQLLKVMATSPLLTLPVMRLLHAATFGTGSSSLPIAEVLTSGLVVRKLEHPAETPQRPEAPAKPLEPEQYQFELLPAVAALLRQQLPAAERRDVISRVCGLVERRWNRSRRSGEPSFEAVLCDPTAHPPERLQAGVVQFASVTARLLDTLPGEAAKAFAERIRRGSGLPPGSPWPSSLGFAEVEFEAAQLVAVPPLETIAVTTARFAEMELQRLPFQTATIQPDLTCRWSEGEAWAYHEPLERAHLPFGATAETTAAPALTLVEIPAGSFLMGSPEEEPGRSADEGPQHEMALASFFMGQTPITQAQWRQVALWREQPGERWGREMEPEPSFFQPIPHPKANSFGNGTFSLLSGETSGDERPVDNVGWLDAMEFCNRLSQRTGRHYTLPSEAQWEYACRAGTTTSFHFGATITPALVNYNGDLTYADGPKGEKRNQTTPVGMFPANAWCLHDMHGNVWEWCLDHWHANYQEAPTDGRAWLDVTEVESNAKDQKSRLLRGGSWNSDPRTCRSAYRARPARQRLSSFGFRVVCLPQDPSLNA